MEVVKAYNNSIVLARTKDRYIVVIGTGCGFGKRPGDRVDESKVSIKFPFTSSELERMNLGLLEQLDPRDVEIVKGLVNQYQEKLGYQFRPGMVFALVDHLRNAQPQLFPDEEHPFRWVVKKLHPAEYGCAKHMVQELSNGPLHLQMPRSEATAIALHMINNQDASAIPRSMDETLHVLRIVTLVEYKLNRSLDRTSLAYSRFVTHLRFLLNRIADPEMVSEDETNSLHKVIFQESSEVARQIVDSICAYIEDAFGKQVEDAERGYLLLHVHLFVDRA